MSVPFKIIVDGEAIEGVYALDGFHMTVRSAYGARRINLGLLKPDRAAKALLRRIVRDATRSAAKPLLAARDAAAAGRETETPLH